VIQLQHILQEIEYEVHGELPQSINQLTQDSKKVQPGDLFVAIKGQYSDGHDFMQEASQRGAAIAVVEKFKREIVLPQIKVADSKSVFAKLTHNFFDAPSDKLKLIGITGTNGKTTTVYLLNQILKAAGLKHGTIGTLGYTINDKRFPSNLTTPDSLTLQQILAEMVSASCSHVVMEVSSHSLALKRVEYIRFEGAVFTNLSQDHLDYHHSMEDYAKAKAILFEKVVSSGFLVYNMDDSFAHYLTEAANARLLSFSTSPDSDYHWLPRVHFTRGIKGKIKTPNGLIEIESHLSGRFNLNNLLAAVAVAQQLQISESAIKSGISQVNFVPGRLQEIQQKGFPRIFIDYAHTPDAIRNVLQSLRTITPKDGQLRVLFGCGGNRDRNKRSKMAQAVEEYADNAVLTTDNPRDEKPEDIIAEAETGFSPNYPYTEIVERRSAIEYIIRSSSIYDIVALLGKGHETYQEIKGVRHPFDEAKIVKEILNAAAD
jgi:UDP-N-acetylmuramoyl-L-alanyl-D-glutamate--2,6-diaminopimelate ligase